MELSTRDSLILRESFLATGYSSPNPPVASVATDFEGRILGSSHTQKVGLNHAERELYLNQFPFHESSPHDLYVTLEPCSHHGRTPPCRDLILNRKPRNLIIGNRDPYPLVEMSSIESLRLYKNQGIHVQFSKEIQDLSYTFLNGFFSRVSRSRPKILIKTAVTREGFFSPLSKIPSKISSDESYPFLMMLRGKVDGIMVGMGTLLRDSPSLDFRIPEAVKTLETSSQSDKLDPRVSPLFRINSNKADRNIIYWEALSQYSQEESIWDLHKSQLDIYQPKRIFWIEGEPREVDWKSALRNQILLREKYPEVSVIFFLKYSKEFYSPSFLKHLDELGKVFDPPESLSPESILESLAKEGVNHLMIEGGNSLYHMFYPLLVDDDEILVIQNSSLSWKDGILPSFWEELRDREPVWSHSLLAGGGDNLFVYKLRR